MKISWSILFIKSFVLMQLCVIFNLVLFCGFMAHSQEGGSGWGWKNPLDSPLGAENFKKKVERKEGSRWTLKEWMEQKEKNRFMDLWLGMNAPSPYEFIIGVEYMDYSSLLDDPTANSPPTNARYYNSTGMMAFYALILGLEVQYENNVVESYQESRGQVNLRLAGNAVQGTHLIFQYGFRNRSISGVSERVNQNYAGLDVDLYIEKHSGLHGAYRYDIPTNHGVLGTLNGSKTEGGLFFDWFSLRIYANYFQEVFQRTLTTGVTSNTVTNTRKGFLGGLKVFM